MRHDMGQWIDVSDSQPPISHSTYLCVENSPRYRTLICYYVGCGRFIEWPITEEANEIPVMKWFKNPLI